jgi:hypothetical protein
MHPRMSPEFKRLHKVLGILKVPRTIPGTHIFLFAYSIAGPSIFS